MVEQRIVYVDETGRPFHPTDEHGRAFEVAHLTRRAS